MEPRLVKCFFYRETFEVLNIDYIYHKFYKYRRKANEENTTNKQKKFKSINNQSTINQSKYKSFRPAWYLAKILNKRHGKKTLGR